MAEPTSLYAILGDIGGTNARLELSKIVKGASKPDVVKNHVYRSADYTGLDGVMEDFLSEFKGTDKYPTLGVVALACPVTNNISTKFANCNWDAIDGNAIATNFNLKSMTLLNDFVAIGHALAKVKDEDTTLVNEGNPVPLGNKAAIGAGTGLGCVFISYLQDDNGKTLSKVCPTEAGHTYYAVHDDEEREWKQYFLKRNPHWDYFHTEQAFCGPSIPFMYEFLAQKEGKEEPCKLVGKEIFSRAKDGSDPVAVKTLEFFLKLYGEFISNWIMNNMPSGGIYLVGGLSVSLKDEISKKDGHFMKNLFNKGFLNKILAEYPVRIVHEVELGLLGSFSVAESKL